MSEGVVRRAAAGNHLHVLRHCPRRFAEEVRDSAPDSWRVAWKDSEEVLLFHGAPWKAVDGICESGFDLQYRGTNKGGTMFGRGMYFAPCASKCDLYADDNERGERCIFLARVLLRASLPRWRRCGGVRRSKMHPLITNIAGQEWEFDSVCAVPREFGGAVDHPEVCVFHNSAALPCVKIIYKHMSSCHCHHCLALRSPVE